MPDLKEYLVTSSDKKVFIVSAKDSKDAIEYVYNNYYAIPNRKFERENSSIGFPINKIFPKSDFKARSLGSMHTEYGRALCIKIGKCYNED
jgi:hypothetical protein